MFSSKGYAFIFYVLLAQALSTLFFAVLYNVNYNVPTGLYNYNDSYSYKFSMFQHYWVFVSMIAPLYFAFKSKSYFNFLGKSLLTMLLVFVFTIFTLDTYQYCCSGDLGEIGMVLSYVVLQTVGVILGSVAYWVIDKYWEDTDFTFYPILFFVISAVGIGLTFLFLSF